jgi:uncharacterized protein
MINLTDSGAGGAASAVPATGADAEQFFRLGMMYSTGQSTAIDMVSAHKCFNIAAMHGVKDAVRLRNEVAAEMSDSEIAAAQRAARAWLMRH